ncbi:gamma-glutamyltransferase [Chroococcidiopsis sp. TS-821]|uniref:gamma-glutamyltransferase n=1 Tax=Chroococcidiopsis sp. TS-821 TaxID=1378066 RepID=UPI000CEE2FC2|nr:gamma-glutamyltransferase [Chroococcidiopsis sp. TS-821]PPS39578.1 gamma-glutamyltransferase [Chroococcidiopsis sp. TS-821]
MTKITHGTIAAGHHKTAEAGIEMFRLGGNAFDAATAAMLASFVTESALTSAGGSGFLLAHTNQNENILFDFFSQTPRQKRHINELNFYPIEIVYGDAAQEFHIGLGAMAVPGNIAGIFHIQQRLGRLPFKVIAEPAIHYAKTGVEVGSFQHYCLNILKQIMVSSPAGKQIYAPTGEILQLGEKVVMRDFADTLSQLAVTGCQEFYQGEIARQLVSDCQEYGGYLTLEDLKSYQVLERTPLKVNYRGNTFLTNPPPSSGGILIAFALELLAKIDLETVGFGTSRHLQILAEVMRLTNAARKDGYNTNIYQQDVAEQFLSIDHIAQYAKQLTDAHKWGSTTHISVVDAEGNAASVTTTHGEGSSYIIPGTGIMMNNILGEEDLNPHGFHQWQENVRISSMMAPTIVLKNNQPEIVLGSGGANRIRTAILQVISNIIDFKMPVEQAVSSPRVHWENNVFNIEPGFSDSVIKAIDNDDDQLILWNTKNMFFGGVHTVMETSEGVISGAGDERRNGAIAQI